MKKLNLLNSRLSYEIAKLGHIQSIVITDAGFPIASDMEKVDLAVCSGVPSFLSVLETTLTEMCVERAVLAKNFASAVDKNVYEQTVALLNKHS